MNNELERLLARRRELVEAAQDAENKGTTAVRDVRAAEAAVVEIERRRLRGDAARMAALR